MSKKQWSCQSVERKFCAVSKEEFKQRLAESFEVLVKGNSQQQNSKILSSGLKADVLSLKEQVPNTLLSVKKQKTGA